jgi:hypothetical protein
LIDHLRTALREIQALPPVEAVATAGPVASAPNEPAEASTKKKSVAVAPPVVVPQELAVEKEVASSQSGSGVKPPLGLTQSPRRGRRRMPHTDN